MSKSVFLVVLLSCWSAACGAGQPTRPPAVAAEPQLAQSRTFDGLMSAALDAYEAELEEAANQFYTSRQASLERARSLGSESRLLFHIRTALQAEGLAVDDLCRYSSDNPGYADHQRKRYIERRDRIDSLLEAIASAPVRAETLAEVMEDGELSASRSGKTE